MSTCSGSETGSCNCMSRQTCSSCQRGCQSSCERGCQSSCESGCQSSCESGCQSKSETNRSPSNPSYISVPSEILEGSYVSVSWGYGSDPDNDSLTYGLQRSIDNGSYKQVYNGSSTSYSDWIPNGARTVRYRLDVHDGYASSSGYVYSNTVKVNPRNKAPQISGSDLNLGSKQEDFSVNYIVTDPDNDKVTVSVKIDDKVLNQDTPITLGVSREIKVLINDFELGTHRIVIEAKDSGGLTAKRVFTFNKVNSAPIISGKDTDLGFKNSPFTIVYTVKDPNGDKVNVVEKVNDHIIKNITNIGEDEQSITITAEMLSTYTINETNTIEIEAKDNKNAVAYRRFTFKRSNFAPVISGADGDIGRRDKELTYTYSATDEEKDAIKMEVFLDDTLVVPEFDAEDNKEYVYELKGFDFLKLPFGKHTLKIVATDSNGLSSTRLVSFTRFADRLIMQLKTPRDTDVAAKKVLVIPGWFVAPGATGKVEVCNNAYDDNPTWEDATVVTNDGRAFHFLNTTKTAEKWGVNIRLTIEKGKATAYSYIKSIGGSIE